MLKHSMLLTFVNKLLDQVITYLALMHWHQLTHRLIDDDDNNNNNNFGKQNGRKTREMINGHRLPCQGYGESLQRVAQRDILTPSSQYHLPFEFFARGTRGYLVRALWNAIVTCSPKKGEEYLVTGTGDPWVVQSRATTNVLGTSTSLKPS